MNDISQIRKKKKKKKKQVAYLPSIFAGLKFHPKRKAVPIVSISWVLTLNASQADPKP